MDACVTLLQATAPVKLPTRPCCFPRLWVKVSVKFKEGWYFTVARRLPPILHSFKPNAGPSCSKAPRGLFVLAYLGRIFTATSISPGLSSRQFSSRSTFRAGRNLPDKEFRYLSTVIVTADVYRGFSRQLAPPSLTLRHWSGLRPYTSLFRFAEPCVFVKQSLEKHLLRPALRLVRHLPKIRRAFLPSSLKIVFPFTLVYSTCLPVSVCGTERLPFTTSVFWKTESVLTPRLLRFVRLFVP